MSAAEGLRPLREERVFLATSEPAAELCGRLLAGLGAQVGTRRDGAGIALAPQGFAHGGGHRVVCEFEEIELAGGGRVASETTAQAVLALGDYVPSWGERPARTGAHVAEYVAAAHAATGVMAAMYAGWGGGGGPAVLRTSPLRALSSVKTLTWAARSRPDAWVGAHVRSRERSADCGYRTADGAITLDFQPHAGDAWLAFVRELGFSERDVERWGPRWSESIGWGDDVDAARAAYERGFANLTTAQACDLVWRHGGLAVPYQTIEACVRHPQAEALDLPAALRAGMPWRITGGGRAQPGGTLPGGPGRPLAGLRVVDIGAGGVGPYAAVLLAWLGADVIRLEPPFDFAYTLQPHVDEVSVVYLACHRGKRSITLDLKDPAGLAFARSLVAGADVVNENFRLGVLDRLGLGYDDVAERNPGIVYCSTNGYGRTGPMAGAACTDPHIQAFAGFAAANAAGGSAPRSLRYYGGIDLVTSCLSATGIVAGLLARRRGGGPVRVQASMLQAVADLVHASGLLAPRAPDGLYAAADGYVALTCRSDGEWTALRQALGDPEALARAAWEREDGRLRDATEIGRALDGLFARASATAWVQPIARAGLPCVRALHDDEALVRKDLWDADLLQELHFGRSRPITVCGPPLVWDVPARLSRAPLPGEDTAAVLATGAEPWVTVPTHGGVR